MIVWDLIKASKVLQGLIAIVVALIGIKGWQIKERRIGAREATAKIETVNDNAIKVGNAGAGKSGVAGMRGQRDPTTRND